MTEGIVEVAWIVAGTQLLTIMLARVFSLIDKREIRRAVNEGNQATHDKLTEVAQSVNGVVDRLVKTSGEKEHSIGKEEGVTQERDRKQS